jgi:hypothetical protein
MEAEMEMNFDELKRDAKDAAEKLAETKKDLEALLEQYKLADARRGPVERYLQKHPEALMILAGISALLAGTGIVFSLKALGW